ncbi:MAG: hypothetical protein HY811_08515 [Planctomycetes bacterium]|nr:hypothetical protein [Planctomycetota bacterium]
MKKIIVISASIILTALAIYVIIVEFLFMLGGLTESAHKVRIDAYSCGEIIIELFVIMVASAAIFDIIPNKLSRIWVIISSVMSLAVVFLIGGLFLFGFIQNFPLLEGGYGYFLLAVLCLGAIIVIITSISNIFRSLRKTL